MNNSLIVQVLASGILYGTPLLIAALGELLSERGGVLNFGLDGYMLIGAVAAFWTTTQLNGAPVFVLTMAILVAMAAGALISLVYAVAAISVGADQIICGLAVWILAASTGLSSYIGSISHLGGLNGDYSLQPLHFLGLQNLPIAGPLLFNQNALVYLSWIMVPAAWFYLTRTRIGLHLRAVGEQPGSADMIGLNVTAYRYAHTIVAGAAAGIAGAFYTLAISPTWLDGITAGAGWIAIALVVCAFWRPELVLVGAYVFGAITGLGSNLQARGVDLPPEMFTVLPYVMTIVAVVLASTLWAKSRRGAPRSLGLSYSRENH